eukprot:197476-Pyramimonas_sp.AAC.1
MLDITYGRMAFVFRELEPAPPVISQPPELPPEVSARGDTGSGGHTTTLVEAIHDKGRVRKH